MADDLAASLVPARAKAEHAARMKEWEARQEQQKQQEPTATAPTIETDSFVQKYIVPDEPAQAPAAPVPDVTKLVSDWEQKYSTVAGHARSAQQKAAQLEADLKLLRENNDFLAQRLNEVAAVKAAPPVAEIEFTAEEKEQYGASVPFLEKVIAKQVNGRIQNLESQLRESEARLKEAKASASQQSETQFVETAYMTIPGLREATQTAAWTEFLEVSVPGTGKTRGQLVAEARNARRLDDVRYWFDSFKAATSPASTASAPTPTVNGVKASVPPAPTGVKKLLYSQLLAAQEEMKRGKLPMESFQKIRNEFLRADREGRVEYDRRT